MEDIQKQFVVDTKGNKTAVILTLNRYEQLYGQKPLTPPGTA